MRKLFSLILLGLLCSVGNVWADDCTTLVSFATSQHDTGNPRKVYGYTSTEMTEESRVELTCDNSDTKGQNSGAEIRLNYGKYLQIPSQTSVTSVTVDYKFYNSGSTQRTCSLKVAVGSTEKQVEISGKNSDGYKTAEFTFSPAATGAIKITNMGSGSSNFHLYLDNITYCTAPAVPTITANPVSANYVTGSDATPLSVSATGTGTLYYQWFSNTTESTEGAVSVQAKSSESGANQYTPSTSSAGTTYYYCAVTDDNGTTNSAFANITVSAATAPTINVSGAGNVVRGGEITLTAEFTGVPNPSIAWYACSSVGVISGEPLDEDASFAPTTSAVGTYYFRAVVNNGVGGDANHDVFSSVQTINILPKAPILTAEGTFTDASKSVTISKADGESGDAVIKYSTDDGANWDTYSDALTITATTTVTAKVVQSGLESAEVSATYTKFVKSELISISSTTTWNWESWNESLELNDGTDPIGTEEYTYSDIAAIKSLTLPSGFNGEAIAYAGVSGTSNYPVRSKKAQAINLHIKTTIPGTLTVKFSDTGKSGDSHNRYLNINGTNTEFYACRHDDKNDTKTVTIEGVPAGDVWIKAVKEDGITETMVVFYSLVFTPVTSVSGTISDCGWSTFSSPYPLDLSEAVTNGTVYFASASNGSTVTLEETPAQVVPAGEGLMVKGTAGETFTIQTAGEAGAAISGNLLKGQTVTGNVSATNHYVFGYVTETPSTYGFYALTATTEVQAGKAYLEYPAAMAPSFLRIVEETGGATNITNIEATDEAVKFIQDGKLYIKRNGVVYDAVGRLVR